MIPFPFPNPVSIFAGFAKDAIGWAWEKVIQGIYTWFAEGLLVLIEFVWGLLDTATTPRLSEDWFVNGVAATLVPIALAVTVATMLMTAIQAALGGRPELIGDTLKEAARAVAGTAFTVVVLDTMIRFADVIADTVWQGARPRAGEVVDGIVTVMLSGNGVALTFLGPLALLVGIVGMLLTTLLLFMRAALLYFVAAFAPLVWSTSVLPMMRGGVRRLVHVTVALVLAKPAIVISLAIGLELIAAAPEVVTESDTPVGALGTMLTGFFCFAIAALSPWVIFKLLPTVEGAAMATGIAGGWGRTAMTTAQAALMVKSAGAAVAASAATRAVPDAPPAGGGFGPPSGGPGGALPDTGTSGAGGGGGGSRGGGGGVAGTASSGDGIGSSSASGSADAEPKPAGSNTTPTGAGSGSPTSSTSSTEADADAGSPRRRGGVRRVVIPSRSRRGASEGGEE